MLGTYLIEVGYKTGVADPAARSLAAGLRHYPGSRVSKVETAQLYRIVGDLSPEKRTRIAKDLLCDPVIQNYQDGASRPVIPAKAGIQKGILDWAPASASTTTGKKPKSVVIDVWYKSGVTDVVGESVLKGIHDLDLKNVSEVRTGMRYRLRGLRDKEKARKIAFALLANPLVHDPIIHAD